MRFSNKKSINILVDGFSYLYLMLYKCDWVALYGVRKKRFCSKKTLQTILWLLDAVLFEHRSKIIIEKQKRHSSSKK